MTSGPPGGGTWTGVAVTVLGTVCALALALAIPPLRAAVLDALRGDTDSVRDDLRDLGGWGVALLLAQAMVHAVIWYPAEILDAAAGFVYGFALALPLVMLGWLLNAWLSYWIGRNAARPLLYKVAGEERFERVERLIHRGGITFLLMIRLVPIIPFSLMGYVCGAARVPLWRFTWTTVVGYLPLTAYFVYVGAQLDEFSLEDPVIWIGGIVLIALLFGIHFMRPGRGRGTRAD